MTAGGQGRGSGGRKGPRRGSGQGAQGPSPSGLLRPQDRGAGGTQKTLPVPTKVRNRPPERGYHARGDRGSPMRTPGPPRRTVGGSFAVDGQKLDPRAVRNGFLGCFTRYTPVFGRSLTSGGPQLGKGGFALERKEVQAGTALSQLVHRNSWCLPRPKRSSKTPLGEPKARGPRSVRPSGGIRGG